jgi:hypothetical protein
MQPLWRRTGTRRREVVRLSPGLTIFTDGSRIDSGAVGYTVAWQKGRHWVGLKVHMGYNQETFDEE